jgi:7-keto-8-aminopelargonate synthetase-like enzyme
VSLVIPDACLEADEAVLSVRSAVLLASPTIRSFLINYARPFIFSTAMSVANVIAIESAFDVVESDEGDEVRLSPNIHET